MGVYYLWYVRDISKDIYYGGHGYCYCKFCFDVTEFMITIVMVIDHYDGNHERNMGDLVYCGHKSYGFTIFIHKELKNRNWYERGI